MNNDQNQGQNLNLEAEKAPNNRVYKIDSVEWEDIPNSEPSNGRITYKDYYRLFEFNIISFPASSVCIFQFFYLKNYHSASTPDQIYV